MEYTGVERRRYKRIDRYFRVKYPSRKIDSRGLFSDAWETVIAHNLSAGGAFFDYDHNAKLGAFLDLKIGFLSSKIPAECVARVVRIEQAPNTQVSRIAVEFVDIHRKARKAIIQTIKNFRSEEAFSFRDKGLIEA